MTLELQIYERTLTPGKKAWQQKLIGHIVIQNDTSLFRFGRNSQTRVFIPRINSYPFISEEQGNFSGEGTEYIFVPRGASGVSLRKRFRFWILDFGIKETMLDKNVGIQVQQGDQFISRDKTARKEIVIEVVRIF